MLCLSEQDLAAAKALLTDPEITVDDVAKRLGVSLATLYRHLPGGRQGLTEGGSSLTETPRKVALDQLTQLSQELDLGY